MTPIFADCAMEFITRPNTTLEPETLYCLSPLGDRYERFYMDGRTTFRRDAARARMNKWSRSEVKNRVR